jgi:sugar/nucleoside kinase (ribokinase family)
MNDNEYEIIAGEEDKKDFFKKHFKPDQILLITNGNSGAEIIYYDYGKIALKNFDAFKLTSIVDTTGCGDTFGAGFVFNYLKTEKLDDSVKFANLVAGANASLRGTNEVHQLKEVMNKIKTGSI